MSRKNQKSVLLQQEKLSKISAGHQFVTFIAKVKENNEIFFQGSQLSSMLQITNGNEDLSINDGLTYNYPLNEKLSKKLADQLALIKLNIHEPIYKNSLRNKSSFSLLSNFEPVQVSAYKNSAAFLLKGRDDFSTSIKKFDDFQNIITEINTILKSKNETFQSYFLNNIHNENLVNYEDKAIFFHDISESEKPEELYKNYMINSADFEDKLNELIGSQYKNTASFIKSLQINRIIIANKINILKFYQILRGYESICTTKLIIVGEFAVNWYNNFKKENKQLSIPWLNIYNNTLSFELPISLLPIKEISIGGNHLLLLTHEGEIYSIGDGTKGATGNGDKGFCCVPKPVKFSYDNQIIKTIAAGGRHSLALNESNVLYSWGCGACGCLGHGNTDDLYHPTEVVFSGAFEIIKQIDAGDNISGCLSEDGNLVLWGNSQFGRIGISKGTNTKVPQHLGEFLENNVASFKCGYMTTLVQTTNGTVFGLGIQSLSDIYSRKEDSTIDDNVPIVEVAENKMFRFKVTPAKIKSKEIMTNLFVGKRFFGGVLYIPDKKEIEIYKGGDYDGTTDINLVMSNILRTTTEDNQKLIEKGFVFENLQDTKPEVKDSHRKEMKEIVCSQNNTAVLTNSGELYVFGSYLYQMARPKLEDCFIPVQPRATKIINFAMGSNHILMISNNKELFVAGRNLEGQLGLGYTSSVVDISVAKSIEQFSHLGAAKAYAAENYSVVITVSSKVYVFGDITFLQNSSHVNKQLSPKEMNWGEVDKIACGSNHLLLLKKEADSSYTIMSVGNGMYGKLGDGDPNGKNHYTPVRVDLPYYNIKATQNCHIKCGKYTSGVIIESHGAEQVPKTRLYMWGLCHHKLFINVKEVEKKHNFGETYPLESTIPIITPALITTYSVSNFAIGEGIVYFIRSDNGELEKIGEFPGRKAKGKEKAIIADQFNKIALGLNHAAAITKSRKLFTWGSNVMHKLGFSSKGEKDKEGTNNEIDVDKFFVEVPSNVVKLNEIFEQKDNLQKDDEVMKLIELQKNENPDEEETETPNEPMDYDAPEGETDDDKKKTSQNEKTEEETKEKGAMLATVYAKARDVITFSKPKFEDLERSLEKQENNLQKKIMSTLTNYQKLKLQTDEAKLCYKALNNMFYFKFGDPPLNVEFKRGKDDHPSKFPPDFKQYKSNFKALLSAFHTHPCYLLNIYKNHLFSDKELYKIIKMIFFKQMRHDRFTQLILISLIKGILSIDLAEKKITNLEDYKIISNEDNQLTLFGKLCKMLFKVDDDYNHRQDVAALYIIGNIFSSVENPNECSEDMLLKVHPEDINTKPKPEMNNYQKNSRIDRIMKQFEYFINDLLQKSSLDKNNLFSLSTSSNTNYKELFKLPEICFMLIKEIVSVMKTVTVDDEKIYDWLSKKFANIMFSHLIKVLENPSKRLAVDATLLVDRPLYITFMENCKDNFYSISYVFRFCLDYLGVDSTNLPEDEINKQIEKCFKASMSSVLINIKACLYERGESAEKTGGNEEKEEDKVPTYPKNFELEFLKEFFNHSLNDSNYIVNFSLYYLRRLIEVIIPNRDKIRVINENYDVMEQILRFNGLDQNKRVLKDVGLEDDTYVQFKLKTKSLCLKTPMTLMRCRNCKTILISDHIIGNEIMFFDQFDFINKTSAKGRYMALLKEVDPVEIKNDKFNNFLKTQYDKKKDQGNFRENLNQLFTLMAVDAKDDLFISEETINNPDKLNEAMFKQNLTNVVLKKYSEEIVQNYGEMKEQLKYYQALTETLGEIAEMIKVKEKEKNFFLVDIYKKIKNSIQLGYGNKEIRSMNNNLMFNCIFVKLLRYNSDLPKSETIVKNLPKSMKEKMEAVRDFEFKKLLEKGIIKNVYQFKQEIIEDPQSFKLSILKNEKFEFIITLIKIDKVKKGMFVCGTEEGSKSEKKLYTFTIDNTILYKMIKLAMKTAPTGKDKKKTSSSTFNLVNFIDVDARGFLIELKKLFNIGFYAE